MVETGEPLPATDEKVCPHCRSPFYQVGGLRQRVVEDTAGQVVRRITCWSCKADFLYVTSPPPPF